MLFSAQKQIIVGSFININNALNDLKRLEAYIASDDTLQELVQTNSIRSEFTTVGKYHVVALSPIDDYVQLLRTLNALKKYYDDAYVLDYPLKADAFEIKPKPKEAKTQPAKEIKKVVEVPKKKIALKAIKKDIPVEEVIVHQEEHYNYMLESILVVLLILALFYIINKRKNRARQADELV